MMNNKESSRGTRSINALMIISAVIVVIIIAFIIVTREGPDDHYSNEHTDWIKNSGNVITPNDGDDAPVRNGTTENGSWSSSMIQGDIVMVVLHSNAGKTSYMLRTMPGVSFRSAGGSSTGKLKVTVNVGAGEHYTVSTASIDPFDFENTVPMDLYWKKGSDFKSNLDWRSGTAPQTTADDDHDCSDVSQR